IRRSSTSAPTTTCAKRGARSGGTSGRYPIFQRPSEVRVASSPFFASAWICPIHERPLHRSSAPHGRIMSGLSCRRLARGSVSRAGGGLPVLGGVCPDDHGVLRQERFAV